MPPPPRHPRRTQHFLARRRICAEFFKNPILNSPYDFPGRHWEVVDGQPTGKIVESRRECSWLRPIPNKNVRPNDIDEFLPGEWAAAHRAEHPAVLAPRDS